MEAEPECVFCQIIAGDAPSTTIAQNERVIAFMDINPATPGHALVIPRSREAVYVAMSRARLSAWIYGTTTLALDIAQRHATGVPLPGERVLDTTRLPRGVFGMQTPCCVAPDYRF